MKNINYSKLSIELTKNLSTQTKKDNGIFFTPSNTVKNNIEFLKDYFDCINNILEPSCGSGEFITEINSIYPDKNITGIEYNLTIFNSVKKLNNDKINIIKENFLKFNPNKKYDLIIGNPPFYVMKKNEVENKYYKYFDGRPNIFILFIIKSLELLNKNGILSFILPKNFLNCLYYDNTRKYINENFNILNIIECNDKYLETQQETITLIIQNKNPIENNNKQFTTNINNYTIFGTIENINKINNLYQNSKTLNQLGFKVSVGPIVWNQYKDSLFDEETYNKNLAKNQNKKLFNTRLIYCSDINNNKLEFKTYKNPEKKNFINKKGINDICLVINRGYGVGEYNFNYCLIDVDFDYLIENHLVCINYNTAENQEKNLKKNELLKMYDMVINSLKNKRTKEFIKLYFSNNAINTTEISEILPIYQV